jgi:hypothetical protein
MALPQSENMNFRLPWQTLTPQAQSIEDHPISQGIAGFQIIQKRPSLAYHLQQASPGVVILTVYLQVFIQIVDPFSEESDLNLGRARVPLMNFKFFDDFFFCGYTESHYGFLLPVPLKLLAAGTWPSAASAIVNYYIIS